MKQIWKQSMLMMVLVLAMVVPVFAADFSDVTDTNWYADELDLMVEMGVVSGYEDGTFKPQNSVTYGEFSKMLCSLSGLAVAEKTEIHWASGFANAVYEAGWLEVYPSDLDEEISRYAVANAVFQMMGYEESVAADNPYADIDNPVASTLYGLGIVKGSSVDGETVFLPDSNVTRAELCAILNRVVLEDTTGMFVAEEEVLEEAIEEVISYGYTLPNITKPDANGIISSEYFDQMIAYMMVNNLESYSCNFDDTTYLELKAAGIYETSSDSFVRMKNKYHELGGFYEGMDQKIETYAGDSVFTLTLKNSDYSNDAIANMKKVFFAEVDKTIDSMFAMGSIKESDSDYNKALYFYQWCAYNLQYDLYYQPASYNGYGALTNGKAICQGYTAVFNALCNGVGIEAVGISGEANGNSHIWSYVNLDGRWLYVDATFGDPIPDKEGYCNPEYFGLTKTEISDTHIFDSIYR